MVGRSIANIAIQPEAPCIYGGAKCRGKYATKVRYRGYGLTYHTIIYDISYGECATDEPFCETAEYFGNDAIFHSEVVMPYTEPCHNT